MKYILCLCVLYCAGCFGGNRLPKTEVFQYEHVGNSDDDAKIERPCMVYDLNCIRQFFNKHAHCTIANGPLPDPYYRSQYDINLAKINVTAVHTNMRITGLNNTRIEEFYINRATNKLVIAIQIREVTLFTPVSYWQFYRNGREPIVAVTNADIYYASATYTTIIPNIDDLQLDKAEITAFFDQSNPPFTIGPEVMNNPDPVVQQAMTELVTDVPTDMQELLLTESPFFAANYIQYNLCDFGLKVF